jgi:hypothetical protein
VACSGLASLKSMTGTAGEGSVTKRGSVLIVEMTVKTRGFTALETEACGLT